MRIKFKCYGIMAILLTLQLLSSAQDHRAAELDEGDMAPALQISKWAKGEPVPRFEKGQIYVVEFTSLYCGPCYKAIPHLHELAEKYAGRITFISVFDVFKNTVEKEYLDEVDDFLMKRGDTINYTVAVDRPGQASVVGWLHTIMAPQAFVVNGSGKIAWKGSPFLLQNGILDELLSRKEENAVSPPEKAAFEQVIDGQNTGLYYIKNKKGNFQAAITNYGARLVYLQVPGASGSKVSVVAGFDSLSQYIQSSDPYYGATIGRVVNRLANPKLALEGHSYNLENNYGPALIHGGPRGFHKKVWQARQVDDATLELMLLSPDGEGGFPGNLKVKVTYRIVNDETLAITYDASTDQPTIINLSNHVFFNLNGEGNGSIVNHVMQVNASAYTPLAEYKFLKGTIEPVEGTPFDFRKPVVIGSRLEDEYLQQHNEQMVIAGGYDHNFVLDTLRKTADGLTQAVTMTGDRSGIMMKVSTTEPGIQIYSGNVLGGFSILRSGYADISRSAFVLQPQHFPDAPAHPAFPSIELRPGEKYHVTTTFSFSHP